MQKQKVSCDSVCQEIRITSLLKGAGGDTRFNLQSILLVASLVSVCPSILAQTEQEAWKKIKAADMEHTAVQAGWRRTHINQPNPAVNVEDAVEKNAEISRQRGASEASVAQFKEIDRRLMTQQKNGFKQVASLDLKRHKNRVLGQMRTGKRIEIGETPDALSVLPTGIEYLDLEAMLSATLQVALASSAQNKPPITKDDFVGSSWVGNIYRNEQNPYPLIGLEDRLFLVGGPIFKDYSPDNSTLEKNENGQFVLKRKVFQKRESATISLLEKWIISPQIWRPVLFERRYDMPHEHNLQMRRIFEDYRQYSQGIWFPSSVREETGAVNKATGKPWFSDEFKLIAVKFNQEADTSGLLRPFPQGTQIHDARFAPRPSVNYTIETGIPSDEFVLKLVKQREAEEAQNTNAKKTQEEQAKKLSSLQVMSLPVGLFLVMAGMALSIRCRRRNS